MRVLKVAPMLAASLLVSLTGAASAQAQPHCGDLGGTVENGTTCHIHAATPTYTFDATYPLGYPDAQSLTGYLTQIRDGFMNASQMPGLSRVPHQLEATSAEYRSGTQSQGTHSVVLKIFQDVGGPQPTTWYKSFTYDLDAHRPITFDDLFKPDSKPLEVIYPIVERELQHGTGTSGTISPGDGLDPTHYQNFAITDDGLMFFFGQGELLPASVGATSAQIPRSAVASLLSEITRH